jgi:ABC-type polysaccharide/polyol phosphate export permease
MFTLIREIGRRRELLLILVVRNLKIRYKNSALGFFWSLLVPLFLILIYALFLSVLRFPIDLPVLVTGIIVWQFLAMCLSDSLHAVLGNANLITKTAFPRIILPLAMAKANLVNFLLSFTVLLVYLMVVGADFGAVYWLPFVVLSQFALCLGLSLVLSCANVFFRDMEHILSVILLAWFFLTPIIYPVTRVTAPEYQFPSWVQTLFFCNPMTGIVTAYRMLLLSVPNPGTPLLLMSFGIAWVVFLIGIVVFQKVQDRFGDEL